MRGVRLTTIVAAAVAVGVTVVSTAAASGTFVEPVRVLHTFQGTNPGANFGWAVSELGDVNGDGAMEAIVGEPFTDSGTAWVFSGRTGAVLYRLDGEPGDFQGFAMADAGDSDGDGIDDGIIGAPGRGAGHAYLYSGATGDVLHTFEGIHIGDFFGWAVAGVGDIDGDGRGDILVGAPSPSSGGNPGAAYVFSGRTYEQLGELPARHHEAEFGSATDGGGDLNQDGVPDLLVGAREDAPGKGGAVYAYSGPDRSLLWEQHAAKKTGAQYGSFFVAGLGDTNGDGVGDVYVGDYADPAGNGRVAVLSGVDGSELFAIRGDSGAGMGPGREAGDVDGDGLVDLAVGSFTHGADGAGLVELRSGLDGSVLRTITSTTPGENFGFDAVGIGDVNQDGRPDLLGSAATGEAVYVIAG
jgi:FG-GAP repeat/FG-GAP-like repeat